MTGTQAASLKWVAQNRSFLFKKDLQIKHTRCKIPQITVHHSALTLTISFSVCLLICLLLLVLCTSQTAPDFFQNNSTKPEELSTLEGKKTKTCSRVVPCSSCVTSFRNSIKSSARFCLWLLVCNSSKFF